MKGSNSVKATKNNMLRCLPLGKNLFLLPSGKKWCSETSKSFVFTMVGGDLDKHECL